MLKLSMYPTGWFQIGWSAEIAPGETRALRYFGRDLVAFRTDRGRLSVMDAHCKHLGAHLGKRGKVKGDCVICPYHGWAWDADGNNTNIPYQDQPTNAKMRTWPTIERHGVIFMWHDPAGGPPRKGEGWELPDLFTGFPHLPAAESDFYAGFPDGAITRDYEPIHPQIMMENAADCMHFRYTHGTPEDPRLLHFDTSRGRWEGEVGFTSPRTKEIALNVYSIAMSVGLTFTVFNGRKSQHRLILSATPVDEGGSDLRISYFLQRDPNSPHVMPKWGHDFMKEADRLFEEDAQIWRDQLFVQRPVFARQDIAGYTALRRWSEQYYEAPEGPTPTRSVLEL